MNDRLDQIDWDITLHAVIDNGEPMAWNLFLAFIPLTLSSVLFYQPQSPLVRWGMWLLFGILAVGSYSQFQTLAEWVSHIIRQHSWVGLGAVVFLGLSLGCTYIYRHHLQFRTLIWWLGVAVFLVFLPNAAYTLTDFIHLVLDIRRGYPMGTVMLFLIPQYLFFIVVGFEAYVVSIMHLELYLLKHGLAFSMIWLELALNGLSAIGVYLGRFARLNSWDLLINPGSLVGTLETVFLSRHALSVIMTLFVIFAICQWLFKRITIGLMQQKQAFRAL